MIAQRMKHYETLPVMDENGKAVAHTPEFITNIFDEELEKLLANPPKDAFGKPEQFKVARRIAEAMVRNGEFDPF
jgi:hypothetical protein